jgi:hypothetical protein
MRGVLGSVYGPIVPLAISPSARASSSELGGVRLPCFVSLTGGAGLSAAREREANVGCAVVLGWLGDRFQFLFLFSLFILFHRFLCYFVNFISHVV